ncbi:MAG: hydrogenase iron-sulfur subunit [Nitrospinae bacterium]|nr:hydrogenase iron-sulfur subunit [Nitrospinota bacterium]
MTQGNAMRVYVCTGCDIGASVDVDKLSKIPAEFGLPDAARHPFLCGDAGLQMLRKEVAEGTNRVLIAACSGRVYVDRFDFGKDVIVERTALREAVWVSAPNDADTQLLAEDYLKMGIVKLQKTGKPEPYIRPLDEKILVVGGGITGMTAALAAANAGRGVLLVEKEAALGGFLQKLKKRFPVDGAWEPVETGIAAKADEVNNHPAITVYLSSEIGSVSGQPGEFDVQIETPQGDVAVRCGAIVQATGFKPYDIAKLAHLGGGTVDNVITSARFEEIAAAGKILRPSDSKEPSSVAFIQCAGSRDEKHLPYCSSFCCMTSLKQARYIREQNPDAKVYIFYRDMRTPGKYEFFYKKMQDDDGVFMTKGDVESVAAAAGGGVEIAVKNTLLGETVRVRADMAVLAVGMESAAKNGGALNLTYRQGPELPELNYGFPDSHFVCFPYETRRTGIYAAGTVRHPMDAAQSQTDAAGAALKAIQCITLAAAGKSAHPRSGDTSYPEIAFERCTQCKRCTEECPYGMYDEDAKSTPRPNPLRCRRCGTCMGACPQRIISFKNYSVDMFSAMIKAIGVPGEEENRPRVLILACENDSMPAFDMAANLRLKLSPHIRVIGLRCLGSLNMVWLSDAFAKGLDGVLLFGCKFGDEYQCHNMKGSELASERLSKLEETLGRMSLEPERVRFVPLAINDAHALPGIIGDFMKVIERVGPNPFKEFAD